MVRFSFQTMVGIGSLLALLGLVYLYLRFRRRGLPRWLLWAVVAAGPLSVVALIAGWITTEVGRQPWIVYDVMKVDQAVTGASDIPVGYGALSVVYVILAVIVFFILRRIARIPLPDRPARTGGGSQWLTSRSPSSWPGWRPTRCWPGPTSAPGCGRCSPSARPEPGYGTRPGTRWGRSGRPTTSG